MSNQIKVLTDREHVLLRPAMYIGATDITTFQEYILEDDKMVLKEVSYVPALIKIINELIDNSVDVAIKSEFKSSDVISVKMTKDSVEVKDNGTGIPVRKIDTGEYMPMIAWGSAKAGSNFEDDSNRTQIGMNGVGSFASNCFSKTFKGITDDGTNKYEIVFKNNASEFEETIKSPGANTGTTVRMHPDLERFGLTEIDDVHMSVIHQRLINLSLSYPKIKFSFNGKRVNVRTFKNYVQMFNPNAEVYETDEYSFAILPNPEDDFRQFSYVNGLKIPDGGTHIDIITRAVVDRVRDKLSRKFKSIKPADIRNKLMVIAFLQGVPGTKFNSQSKEKITNSITEINAYFNKEKEIPYDSLVNKILRNKEIIDPITEIYRIKEEFKKRQELKSLNKPKTRIRSDKYLPPIGKKKYLFLAEGQCLEENTEVMMADYSTKLIKDVNVGDKIISGDLSVQTVQAQTKLLKPTVTIKTATSEVVCGVEHRLKVYDINSNSFVFVEARVIKSSPERYKIVKSKINKDTHVLEVQSNDAENLILDLGDQFISYTLDDNFVIIREGIIMRVHSTEIIEKDLITLG